MVLINNLTIDEINAALLHLQRARTEVVGGVKGNTTQNISITNSGGGGGNNVDYSGAIQNLANNIEKNSESIEGIKVDVHNLEETIRNLSDAGISDLSYDNLSHQLIITTENGDTFQAQITQDVATLSFDPATNELSITTGEQTQTITLPIPSAQVQSDWTQTDNTELDFIKNKIPIWITSGSADDNMSPVDVVEPGNTRPVTSGGVANVLALPTDAVLHYSFDEVPDYPDGTAVYKRDNDWTSNDNWASDNSNTTFSVNNGVARWTLTNTSRLQLSKNISNISNKICRIKIKSSQKNIIARILAYYGGDYQNIGSVTTTGNWDIITTYIPQVSSNNFIIQVMTTETGAIVEIAQIYIGDGSYSTPIIDNANGQNNGTNNGGIAVQGVSGKGAYFPSGNQYALIPTKLLPAPTSNDNFSISFWLNIPTTYDESTSGVTPILVIGSFSGLYGLAKQGSYVKIICRDAVGAKIITVNMDKGQWKHYVMVYNGNTHQATLYVDAVSYGTTSANTAGFQFGSGDEYWRIWGNRVVQGIGTPAVNRPATFDDILFFKRALSETEVQALYLNKANTPKYYSWADWKLQNM